MTDGQPPPKKKGKRGKKTPVAGTGATEPASQESGATNIAQPAPDSAAPTLIDKAPQSEPVPVRISDSAYSTESQPVAAPEGYGATANESQPAASTEVRTESGTSESRASESSESRASESRASESRASEASESRASESRASESRASESASESRASESRASESRASESRASESRASESRASESRASESRAPESRALESASESRASESASESRASELRASESRASESASESRASESRASESASESRASESASESRASESAAEPQPKRDAVPTGSGAIATESLPVPTTFSGSVAISESAIVSETPAGFASAPALAPPATEPVAVLRPEEPQRKSAVELIAARPVDNPVDKPVEPIEKRDAALREPDPGVVSSMFAIGSEEASFLLAPEHSEPTHAHAHPLVPNPPILPSPAEAALEAARIVSQMVDIDSESGAVIAAAAAAGAAIEAAVAAQKVHASDVANDAARGPHDPFSTVRLSRDRILRALHDDVESREGGGMPSGPRHERARTDPGNRPSQPNLGSGLYGRARTEPGADPDEPGYEEFDPVAIAAAAISRLRARARTDLAELRVHYHRHDLLVLIAAFAIIVGAGRLHYWLVTPPTQTFSQRGLTFEHSASWLAAEPTPPPAPRLARELSGPTAPSKDDALYHVELTSSLDPNAKIEILIDKKPTWSNIVTGLELDRRTRWGELYALDDSSVESIAGHDWLRTAYRYAHATEKGDIPRVDRAIEYATIDRDQIYVVTLFGSPLELSRIEETVGSSLRVPTQTGLPLVPQTSRLSQRKYPNAVGKAFDSTIMVVVADLIDGRLKARGGGSGVIVGGDGSILTNYHVIHDKEGRLHDVFVIGRFAAADQAPRLWCAGRPSRSKLQRDLDLALIKCDTDLDGRAWNPSTTGVWQTLPELPASQIKMGQRLWVLGYPDVGGGGLTLSEGEVEGWTGEDGTQGRDFIKTDASITHGNSGGPVVDDQGKLVGVASAFRTKVTASGSVVETAQVGLVRPLQTASCLLDVAAAGWIPREGHTECDLTPSAVEAAAEGVRISTVVLDVANESPIRDALVMVLRPGVSSASIDMNRLDDQAIAWGKTNAQGEVRLKQPVPIPGNYTVMVLAPGYEPLIGEQELHLDAKTPSSFDPWGKIELRAR